MTSSARDSDEGTKEERDKLSTENEALKTRIAALQQEMSDLLRENQELQQANGMLKQDLGQRMEDDGRKLLDSGKIQQANVQLKRELESARESQQANAELREELDKLRREKSDLQLEKDGLQEDHAKARQELIFQQLANSELKQQLGKWQQKSGKLQEDVGKVEVELCVAKRDCLRLQEEARKKYGNGRSEREGKADGVVVVVQQAQQPPAEAVAKVQQIRNRLRISRKRTLEPRPDSDEDDERPASVGEESEETGDWQEEARAKHSPRQLKLLHAELRRPRKKSQRVYRELARETGLTERQVYDWMYYRQTRLAACPSLRAERRDNSQGSDKQLPDSSQPQDVIFLDEDDGPGQWVSEQIG